MMALTLWPEWIWAILHLGRDVENRLYPPDRRLQVGDVFALHAGKEIGGPGGHNSTLEGLEYLARTAAANGWEVVSEQTGPLGRGRTPEWRLTFYHPETNRYEVLDTATLVRGGVAAVATLDEDREEYSAWAAAYAHPWPLRDVVELERPVPCRGFQKLWRLGGELERQVWAQVLDQVEDGCVRR